MGHYNALAHSIFSSRVTSKYVSDKYNNPFLTTQITSKNINSV